MCQALKGGDDGHVHGTLRAWSAPGRRSQRHQAGSAGETGAAGRHTPHRPFPKQRPSERQTLLWEGTVRCYGCYASSSVCERCGAFRSSRISGRSGAVQAAIDVAESATTHSWLATQPMPE